MSDAILVLNAGSSRLRFSLYSAARTQTREHLLCEGEVEGIGHSGHIVATDRNGRPLIEDHFGKAKSHEEALHYILRWLNLQFTDYHLFAVGHRVVHGGPRYITPVRIDAAVILTLRRLIPLAPLDEPHHIAAIEALAKLHPDLPQIACFDTAFHQTEPAIATTFAIPRRFTEEGVRRYGFHGLSYEYVASVLPGFLGEAADGRVVVAHLGSGASLCAMQRRRSVATTMSFTPLDGLPMATQCGNLDPAVVLYLIQEKGMSVASVRDLLSLESGLLGVSGVSDDMRTLLADNSPFAREAVDLFVYRVARELGSLAAAISGIDAIVFTAGIGEHSAEIRQRVLRDAAWLGVIADEDRNRAGGPCLTRSESPISAWVIPTHEDLMIARHTMEHVGLHACR